MPRRSRSRSQKSKSRKSHSYKKRARPQKRSSRKRPTVHRRRRLSTREANPRAPAPYSMQFAGSIRQRAPQTYAMILSKPANVPVPSNNPVSDAKAEAIMKEEAAKFF